MSRRSLATLSSLLVLAVGMLASPALAADPRVIAITGNDAMQYSVKRIEAKPGEKLKVVLSVVGSMPKAEMAHNFVLLAKGTDPAAFSMAAAMARATEYVPAAKKAQILASTKLVGAGEKTEIVFDAPKEPGEYVYICTFPGHFTGGMKGVLVVK